MLLDIYSRYENRPVRLPAGAEQEALESIRALSLSCKENVLMLEMELGRGDPEAGARCGVLDGDVEVYAIPVPACRSAKLVVSIGFGAGEPPPAVIHGAVPARSGCRAAHRLVARHRGLAGAAWEPA